MSGVDYPGLDEPRLTGHPPDPDGPDGELPPPTLTEWQNTAIFLPENERPRCAGMGSDANCADPVTMLDTAGFVYCTKHGTQRRQYEPCRKLRPHELNRLARGETIERY